MLSFSYLLPQDLKILRTKSWNCLISGEWTSAASWKKQKCLGWSKFIMTNFSLNKNKESSATCSSGPREIDKLCTIPRRLMGFGTHSPVGNTRIKPGFSETPRAALQAVKQRMWQLSRVLPSPILSQEHTQSRLLGLEVLKYYKRHLAQARYPGQGFCQAQLAWGRWLS